MANPSEKAARIRKRKCLARDQRVRAFDARTQVKRIQLLFTTVAVNRVGRKWNVRFDVKTAAGNVYKVRIELTGRFYVNVFISNHEFEINTPHLFRNGSLCLYHKSLYQWNAGKMLMDHIIPWTCHWLHYYELWKLYGIWLGEEFPHDETQP